MAWFNHHRLLGSIGYIPPAITSDPDFQRAMRDPLPSGDVDLDPTLTALLNPPLHTARGRLLHEALAAVLARPLSEYAAKPPVIRPAQPATRLKTVRIDGTSLPSTCYSFTVGQKRLSLDSRTWTYFDQAAADR